MALDRRANGCSGRQGLLKKMLEKMREKLFGQTEQNQSKIYSSFYSEINCYELGRVPLEHITVGDLRVMISQKIGLAEVVPLALGHLERDPMVSGIYYPSDMDHPGDLLESVQHLPSEFWEQHPDLQARWQKIEEVAVAKLPTV